MKQFVRQLGRGNYARLSKEVRSAISYGSMTKELEGHTAARAIQHHRWVPSTRPYTST
jgi:hypothetical protein